VSTPSPSSRYTRSSVAMLPVARGVNGQPPRFRPTRRGRSRLPRARSRRSRNRCSVCCGNARRADDRARRPARRGGAPARGVAAPAVSARTSSPASVSRRASATTRSGSTSRSKGQPKATLIVTVVGRSAEPRTACARPTDPQLRSPKPRSRQRVPAHAKRVADTVSPWACSFSPEHTRACSC
jgi:hypothetical protein